MILKVEEVLVEEIKEEAVVEEVLEGEATKLFANYVRNLAIPQPNVGIGLNRTTLLLKSNSEAILHNSNSNSKDSSILQHSLFS